MAPSISGDALRRSAGSGLLEVGQGAAGVPAGEAQQVGPGLVGQLERAGEAALFGEGAVEQRGDVGVGERLQGEQERAAEQRRDHRERRVLRCRGDQGDQAVLDGRQQHVLLGLGEAVHLVDEQDGAGAAGELALGLRERSPHLLDAGRHRRQLDEPSLPGGGDDRCDGGLADARRPPEEDRHRRPPLGEAAQGRAGGQQVVLADDLVHRAWAHPDRQWRVGVAGAAQRARGRRRCCAAHRVSEQVRIHLADATPECGRPASTPPPADASTRALASVCSRVYHRYIGDVPKT